ncbi:unnamed protein product [Mytilus edulis]|uniref:Ig-like domain-containing protein n=1 Tax=Mytilus edulis TaxID=6550 RepID=A0A8S3T8A2_MYTED|nr:unnamed protein product [Mytilus edulis]
MANKLYTNVSTNCIFLKSTCNEEGQVIYEKGNRNSDTTCRCDYTRGYNFLLNLKIHAFCVPSQEDCSCFLKACPKSTDILSPDYECLHVENNITLSECKLIHERRKNVTRRIAGCWKTLKITGVTLNDAGFYCLEVSNKKSEPVKLSVQRVFTSKIEPHECIEGSTIQLTCSVYADNIEVKWYKEEHELQCQRYLITSSEHDRMLTIKNTTVGDSGMYHVKATNVQMKIPVTVKAIITRPLENVTIMEGLDTVLECETEEENRPVQWFKNGKEISNQSDKIRMTGNLHNLTILQTSLDDSGTYTVKTKGRTSHAELTVKEMPATIKQMSVQEKDEFLKAAKSGTTIRYDCRVMIVGENEVGKTCLLRRLMNEKIDDVQSTDGINILRRKCQINIKSGEWHFPTAHQTTYQLQALPINTCPTYNQSQIQNQQKNYQYILPQNMAYRNTAYPTQQAPSCPPQPQADCPPPPPYY